MSDLKYIDNSVKQFQKANDELLDKIRKYLKLFLDLKVEESDNILRIKVGSKVILVYLCQGSIILETGKRRESFVTMSALVEYIKSNKKTERA